MTVAGSPIDHTAIDAAFAGALEDPWPVWSGLYEAGPVVPWGGTHLVTHHAECKQIFTDNRRFSNDARRRGSRAEHLRATLTPERWAAHEELNAFHSKFMVTADGELHRRLRSTAHRAFTPRRIEELRRTTEQAVSDAIDAIQEQGTADLAALCVDIPLTIMSRLLDVPAADGPRIKQWSEDWFHHRDATDDDLFLSVAAQRNFLAYIEDILAEHRRNPNPTQLVHALVTAEQDDDRLEHDEVAAMFFMLLFAGHDTTSTLLAAGLLALLRQREQWQVVVDEPAAVPNAVEELLRWVSPVAFLHRFALEDMTIADTAIAGGSSVTLMIASANRDPAVFPDPEVLDVTRPPSHTLTFGHGPHFCLGTSLARLEAAITIAGLAKRLPELALGDEPVTWREGAQIRGVRRLPVTVGRPRRASR